MTTSVNKQISTYKTIEFCPMYNYYKARDSGDNRYLLKIDDYEELPELENKGLVDNMYDIMTQEISDVTISNSQRARVLFDMSKRRDILISDYTYIESILKYLWQFRDDDMINELELLGHKINTKRDYHQELKRIGKRAANLLSKAKVQSAELEEMSGIENSTDIYKEKQSIERVLGRHIDMHKTTVREWLSIKIPIIEESRKNQTNGR